MNNKTDDKIVMMLLCGLNDLKGRELFFKILPHEPTDEDKESFLKEMMEQYTVDENLFYNLNEKYICKENICLLTVDHSTIYNMRGLINGCEKVKEKRWKNK